MGQARKGGSVLFAVTPDKDAILAGLNPEQVEAVTTTEGPLLVVAGAGSGKTSVLTRRIAYLISEKRVAPWSILAITFTNKAAREMRERLDALIGAYAADIWAATFHSTCVRILRRDIDKLGWKQSFTILDDSDTNTVIKRILLQQNVNTKMFDARAVKAAISQHKNVLRTAARARDLAGNPFEVVASEAYLEYERELRRNHSLDFDDLIMKTVQLFEQAPEVLEFYQNKFRYIHVDEYQDTNHAQYRLVNLLAMRDKNLCVVGDSDQSIYGWRGADIQNILEFERDYPNAKVVLLEQNYRSTKKILQIANHVIENNAQRKPKTLRTDNADGDGAVLYNASDERDEARYIADTIESEHTRHHVAYDDMAVLYRTNAQSRVIEEVLMQQGIPYHIYGGLKFYDRREIKDLLAYLRLVSNPADDISLRRVINVPKRGIGSTTLERLEAWAVGREQTLFDAISSAEQAGIHGKTARTMAAFAELIRQLNQMAEFVNLTDLTREVIKRSEYRDALEAERTLESEARIENLDEFLTVTMEFDRRFEAGEIESTVAGLSAGIGRLNEFLAEVALVADTDLNAGKPEVSPKQSAPSARKSDNAKESQVALMTLHSAKGLEFPYVFIAGLEEGIFPHNRALSEAAEMEEERRLCYMGLTRAKKRLYLTCSRDRQIFGQFHHQRPSRFLLEMPQELLEAAESGPGSWNAAASTGFGEQGWQRRQFTSSRKHNEGFGHTPPGTNRKTADSSTATAAPKSFDYSAGDKVEHRKWGTGTVIQVKGSGEDATVTIAFPAPTGIKQLAVKFAPIQKVTEEE